LKILKQLYRLIPNVELDDAASYSPLSRKFSSRVKHTPALFVFTWPDGSPCVLMELYLQARSLEVTVNSIDGGTLGTEASQLSHIIRFCWQIKKDFWELEQQDLRDFITYLMSEKHPHNPSRSKRNNNTVNNIVDLTIRYLKWLQDNIFVNLLIVGSKQEDSNIWLKTVNYTDWRGRRSVALKFPNLPPKATQEPKSPIGRDMKRLLWNAISTMADPSKQSLKYIGQFSEMKEMIEELAYLKKRRELLLELLEATGARPGELSQLLVSENESCSTKNTIILITLKRRKFEKRSIPIDVSLAIRIELFIAKQRRELLNRLDSMASPQDRLFLTTKGTPLEVGTIEREFSRIVSKAGIGDVQACMSMFRHRFITNMVMIHLKSFMSEHEGKVRTTITDADYRTILKRVATFTGHGHEGSLEHYIDLAWTEMGVFDYVEPAISLMNAVEGSINTLTALMGDIVLNQKRVNGQQVAKLAIEELENIKNRVTSAIKKGYKAPLNTRRLFPDGAINTINK